MVNADLIVGFASVVVGIVVFAVTRDLSRLGVIFINYTVVVILSLSALMIIKGFVKPERLAFFESTIERNNVLIGLVILVLYLILMPLVGFLASSYLFYACFNVYLAPDRWTTGNIIRSLALSAVVVTFFFVVFKFVLSVPLPVGIWSD